MIFLVREHLLLIRSARSIDLSSVEALQKIAEKVSSLRRLRMLFILSMADSWLPDRGSGIHGVNLCCGRYMRIGADTY